MPGTYARATKVSTRLLKSGLRSYTLLQPTLAGLLVRLGSLAIAVVGSVFFARTLGPHDYGLYAYVVTWSAILATPTGLGFPQYLIRRAAVSDNALSIVRWADRRAAIAGLAAALAMLLAAAVPQAPGARALFIAAAPLPLLASIAGIRQAIIQGRGEYVASQWPTLLLGPLALLLAFSGLLLIRSDITPTQLMLLTTAAALAPLPLLARKLRQIASGSDEGSRQNLSLRSSLPFMWLGLLYLVNSRIDLLFVGAIRGASEAGTYAVAARAAELVGIFLIVIGGIMAPKFARLHVGGDRANLQAMVTRASRLSAALTLPIAIAMIAFPGSVLAFFFGARYADGAAPLRILAIGQAINVAAGPMGMLLNMTGHERLSAISVGAGVAINFVLNAALVRSYGAIGAAIATSSSIILWNLMLLYWAKHKLGIKVGLFGL